VTLVGFGTFSVATRGPRTGRNPRDGSKIKIAAKKVAKFKPGKKLADDVNGKAARRRSRLAESFQQPRRPGFPGRLLF